MSGFPATVLLILGLAALGVLRSYLRNRQRIRLYEMAHRERMLAMEQGLPVSEVPAGSELDAWLDDAWTDRLLDGERDRRMALAMGLVLLCAGTGALLLAWRLPATSASAETMKLAATLGVIPLMASFGLLLYYRLTAPSAAAD